MRVLVGMSHDELEKLIKAYLELDSSSQAKVSTMIYNWESLGGKEEIDEASSLKMASMVKQSDDCWRTDIDEFWIVFKSFDGHLLKKQLSPAKYGLHRMLLSINDISHALRLIKIDNNRNYKVPSRRELIRYFRDDSNYLRKKISHHEKRMIEKDNHSVRVTQDYFIMKYDNGRHLRGLNPYELHKFYLAQFEV